MNESGTFFRGTLSGAVDNTALPEWAAARKRLGSRQGRRPAHTATGPKLRPLGAGSALMAGDLTYLVWSAILTVVMMLIAVAGTCQQVGLPMLAGDRQGMPEITGWAGRATRAHY